MRLTDYLILVLTRQYYYYAAIVVVVVVVFKEEFLCRKVQMPRSSISCAKKLVLGVVVSVSVVGGLGPGGGGENTC